MKKILYASIICILLSTISLIMISDYKYLPSKDLFNQTSFYSIRDFCLDLSSKNIDFYIDDFSHNLFLSDKSKKIKTESDSILIYIYKNNISMESDSKTLLNYQNKIKNIKQDKNGPSLFYKKDILLVQYDGDNPKIKKTLDSILGFSFLKYS